MLELRRGGPCAALVVFVLASTLVVLSTFATAAAGDFLALGEPNVASRTGLCFGSSKDDAFDDQLLTDADCTTSTTAAQALVVTLTASRTVNYVRIVWSSSGSTQRFHCGDAVDDFRYYNSDWVVGGSVDTGYMSVPTPSTTTTVTCVWNPPTGTNTLHIHSMEAYGSNPGLTAAPAWNAVYVCDTGTNPCDLSTSASSAGWSPAAHALVITGELADTGARPCDVYFTEVDGTGSVFVVGGLQHPTSVTLEIATYDDDTNLRAGAHLLTCTDPTEPTMFTTWSLVLRYTGEVDGSSNVSVHVVPPGATYNPARDVGDGTPLSAIFGAWDALIGAYQVRAPFVFFQPAADFLTGTKANLDAAKMSPAPGRYGPTTCPGYTFVLPSPPVVHYTDAYGAAASSQPWPADETLPSFTVLRCEDFETIVSGWSWWHQARGLVDVGLYVGYGLFWLKRLQPRTSLNG